jgi:predicted MFS family arabinose efflux permease
MTRKYALYALAIIFFANFLNYLDRMLISALEKPLIQSLQLTGTEFGLLWTLFTFGYILSAPFVGFFTDRYRRTMILAICIVILSGATMASGLAQTKLTLYVSRFFLGVGEAGCLIIGPTLISDFFLRRFRGRALSIFYLGLPLGGTAAYTLGGLFEKYFSWREAFFYAGIPGILLAVFVAMLREPRRGKGEGQETSQKIRGLKPYMNLLRTKTLMYIIFAEAFAVIIIVPILHFGKGFFEEARGLDPLQASLMLGVIALVAGVLGSLSSGILGDYLSRKMNGAYAFIAGVCYFLGLPFLIGSFFVSANWLFFLMLGVGCFFYFMCMPAVNTQIANVTHPNQRAMAFALAIFALHLFGDMMTPPVFGMISDSLTKKYDPVEVRNVRVVLPEDSLKEGPVRRFQLQYKSYGEEETESSHGEKSAREQWVPLPVLGGDAEFHSKSGWFSTRNAEMRFEVDPVRTTRIRWLQDTGGGPAAHPNQARVRELEAYPPTEGVDPWPVVWTRTSSGSGEEFLADGDLEGAAWESDDGPGEHSAQIVFGFPGNGRRLTFLLFSIFMLVSSVVCFMARRHAGRDAARVMESLTEEEKKSE